jgi:hypothetical protein
MPIDDLVGLLRDHEVGLWCKRAAWLIAIVNTVLVAFHLLGLLTQGPNASLPIALLETVLNYVVTTLWYFFVLYALGAITSHLVRS